MMKLRIGIWEDFNTGITYMTVVDRRGERKCYWWESSEMHSTPVAEGLPLQKTTLGDPSSGEVIDLSEIFMDLVEVWNAGNV